MITLCMDCNVYLGQSEGDDALVSHGICAQCFDVRMNQLERAKEKREASAYFWFNTVGGLIAIVLYLIACFVAFQKGDWFVFAGFSVVGAICAAIVVRVVISLRKGAGRG